MDTSLTDSDGFIVDNLDPLWKAYVPDWHGKGPNEERDIDEWAEDRDRKGEKRQWGLKDIPGRPPKGVDKRTNNIIKGMGASKTWIDSLMEQGFTSPVIKEVTKDGSQMWFINNGVDYIANLGLSGSAFVEKAVFKPTQRKPHISYAPTQSNRDRSNGERNVQGEPYKGDTIDEEESTGL